VARQLIKLSGKPIDIQYTGLRPGEKMDEVLFGQGEPDERPVHPLVSHVEVPAFVAPGTLALDPYDSYEAIVTTLQDVCSRMAISGVRNSIT
jgi:FlaA1/EpsC-like NDP-sugar epimerase